MSSRLHWHEPATDGRGAFAVAGSPLWLLWREDAAPDRLGQDPGERDGHRGRWLLTLHLEQRRLQGNSYWQSNVSRNGRSN